MLTLIQSIHAEFKGSYGSPRMVRELRLRGFLASKERVERLMLENDIPAKHKRRFKATTDSKHNLPIAPNLLERNFTPDAPNQVWTFDITYLRTDEARHNAPTESCFGSFKNERVYGERFETRDEVIAMAFEYIEVFYNRKLLYSTLGYKSPMQFLNDWFNAQQQETHTLEDEKQGEVYYISNMIAFWVC
jgi:putative transposase